MNRPTWLLVVAGPTLVATFGVSSANGTPACPRSSTQLTASGVPAAHREIVRGAVGCVTAASGATPEEWSARLLAELRPLLAQQVARAAGPARAAALRHSAVSLGVLERDARSRLVASERVPLQRPLAGGLTGKASVFDQPNTDSQHVGGAVVLDAAVSDQAGVVASERRRWSTETQRCSYQWLWAAP